MKYAYAYKTPDGARHEDAIDAPSRDAAFAELRKRGIRPIKVVAADGSKANGEVRGVRKRVVFLIVAALTLLVAIVSISSIRTIQSKNRLIEESKSSAAAATSPRHQIYGDPAIVEAIERGKTEAFLTRPGDRLLAWFAQPGKYTCPKTTTPAELRRLNDANLAALQAAAESDVAISDDDPREVRELKQMVNGVRAEMREYLANGNGTIRSFWRRLVERTREEAQIYERTRRELERESDAAVWERKNDALRNLGLRTIPVPEEK